MTENTCIIPIRADLRPSYYDDFHCLASDCQISCCKGWRISFNKKDYLTLRRQTGSEDLSNRLQCVRRIRSAETSGQLYGEFNMEGGTCALLREDGLCQLQVEKGPKVLPMVCKKFPRTEIHSVSGYLERSLSLACEGVLALLWDLPEGVDFYSDPIKPECHLQMVDPTPLHHAFQAIRSQCIDLLQDRRFPLPERILMMGLALKELADGEEDIPAWLRRTKALPETEAAHRIHVDHDSALPLFIANNICTLLQVQTFSEVLFKEKQAILDEIIVGPQNTLHPNISVLPYQRARQRYQAQWDDREYFMENLMVALFYHLQMPAVTSPEELWKSYVNFCNLYSFYRFMMVMSCRKGTEGGRDDLFRTVVFVSRCLIHNKHRQTQVRDDLFQRNSATLAHMVILLSG